MFTFNDILKPKIWGGTKITKFKGYDNQLDGIGESWEISVVEGSESVVAQGPDAGLTISQLIDKYGEKLLGKSVVNKFGLRFPLLVKFIDAKADLSVQVHPNDEQAKARHGQRGKTEMWYVMDSDDDASLKVGFKHDMTKDEYVQAVEHSTIVDALCSFNVKKGDVFFLPPGRIHTIGAGSFVAEIQESSDITYRIYDYDRVGEDGKKRELHTQQAADVIDYKAHDDYKVSYEINSEGEADLVRCKHFTTSLLVVDKTIEKDYSNVDSFVVLMFMNGNAVVTDVEIKEKNFNLNESEVANIIYQIAQGVKYLHKFGIVHRDLKPDNIMIIPKTENNDMIIKIMDFGFSKIVSKEEKLTEGFGTLYYAAPELIQNLPYNIEIDLWSLGVIIYYIFTGCYPFNGKIEDEIEEKILEENVEFKDGEWEVISEQVQDLIIKCLEKNPEERITIDEFINHPWFQILNKKKNR